MLKYLSKRATHPGAFLRMDLLPAARMSQAELARQLGVSRRTIVEIIHERRRVTAHMAARLAQVFGTTPEFWEHLQRKHDVLIARGKAVTSAVERAINGHAGELNRLS
jgi:addiction module HigA family antidote